MNTALTLAAENPLEHVVDKTLVAMPGGSGIFETLISLHMVSLAFTSLLLVLIMLHVARCIRAGAAVGSGQYVPKGRLAQAIEVVCLYLRNEIVEPQLGEKTDTFIGYIWTVFFFILLTNLFGLVPLMDIQHLFGMHDAWLGGTATANIADIWTRDSCRQATAFGRLDRKVFANHASFAGLPNPHRLRQGAPTTMPSAPTSSSGTATEVLTETIKTPAACALQCSIVCLSSTFMG